jgi:hypothetical protein
MKKKKRNRGGQKGNRNAPTHGFYASSLTPGETCRFLNQGRLEPDVILRTRYGSYSASFRGFTRLIEIPGEIAVMFTKQTVRVFCRGFRLLHHF